VAKKNRELQRVPSEELQRGVLQSRVRSGYFRTVVSAHPDYGLLRAQLELMQDADKLAPATRGPKPKRDVLIRLLSELQSNEWDIFTSENNYIVRCLADILNLSPIQVRDHLHKLKDMLEKLRRVD
jgi:hypothetical protein